MDTKLTRGETKSLLLAAWEKHEKIAMHFNDLILKLRIQALGALAAVVTIGGILLRTAPKNREIEWGLIACVFAILLLFWIAIWFLDFLYYNRLLMGAVDSLLDLEEAINSRKEIEFNMSHKIEASVRGDKPTHRKEGSMLGPWLFYSIVVVVLFAGTIYSTCRWFHT